MLVQLSSAEIGISRQKLLQIPLIPARDHKLHQSVKTKNQKPKNKNYSEKIFENLSLQTDNVVLNQVGNFNTICQLFYEKPVY